MTDEFDEDLLIEERKIRDMFAHGATRAGGLAATVMQKTRERAVLLPTHSDEFAIEIVQAMAAQHVLGQLLIDDAERVLDYAIPEVEYEDALEALADVIIREREERGQEPGRG